ncbi:class F sortase [Kitasatospora sp. SolWspMP-SS2h]|uniref:class F sortase n=1 Tax=Kitasatospora sp. SolWspMP-SS2h TaxID=1305729 RepID=UPI0011B93D8D|nr:class F sortase [Kitasatospora sp. SolWspMP-SS2h]
MRPQAALPRAGAAAAAVRAALTRTREGRPPVGPGEEQGGTATDRARAAAKRAGAASRDALTRTQEARPPAGPGGEQGKTATHRADTAATQDSAAVCNALTRAEEARPPADPGEERSKTITGRAGAAVARARVAVRDALTRAQEARPPAGPGEEQGGTVVGRAGAAVRAFGPCRVVGAGAVAAGLALAGLGVAAVVDRPAVPAVAQGVDVGELPATVHGAAPVAAPTAPTASEAGRAPVAPPVRLRIPRIGVDTGLSDLQVQEDGHLAAPADPDVAGWWSQGPAPGGPGTAVIVGHVDSLTGPAVFAGLSVLRPGDGIDVLAADGTGTAFTVQALRSYDKQGFPAEQVFGDTPGPSLRLITCDGVYDHGQHTYPANLVVFAVPARAAASAAPTGATPPPAQHPGVPQ